MKYLCLLFVISISAFVFANDEKETEQERELGITFIKVDELTRADKKKLILDLPDYNEDTLAKEIEINEKYHDNLKYQDHHIKKSM